LTPADLNDRAALVRVGFVAREPHASGEAIGPVRTVDFLAGRYRLLVQLGRGGMGVVWRARDERLGRDVAVKLLHDWVADDPELRRRFEREAAALARLQHPHVVRLYDVVESDGRAALVLELVEGESLAVHARSRVRVGWDEARRLCAPVAAALAYAHGRGVVHRDLTPANILVERASGRVVVSDFGLARLIRSPRSISPSHGLVGTPEYWSPEQAAGQDTAAPSDLYALGCILYELLSGRLPFEGEGRLAAGLRRIHRDAPSLADRCRDAPHEACALVDALLARAPEARPSALETARALRADAAVLPRAASSEPGTGRATLVLTGAAPTAELGTLARRRRPYRVVRAKRVVGAAAAAGVVGVAGAGVYALAGREPAGFAAPRLVGASLADARSRVAAAARGANVEPPAIRIVGRAYTETAPSGAVIAQAPLAGRHVEAAGIVRVRISLGSPWADVPDTSGEETGAALSELASAGFRGVRRYGPSVSVPAWHIVETRPAAGARAHRPGPVELVVSTGPPHVPVPEVRGADADDAVATLEAAGFPARVDEVPSTNVESGRVVGIEPAPGTRTRLGTRVRVLVARAPRWTALASAAGSEARDVRLEVPAGARVVLKTDNTSFLGLFDGAVAVSWAGDDEGEVAVYAGDDRVLLEPAEADRAIFARLRPDGSARWALRVEALR
jgi:serine/threonine-protein kinase